MGAAHMAGVGVGVFTLESLKRLDRGGERFTPRMDAPARAKERRQWLQAVARARGLAVHSQPRPAQ
jgi:glycerol kinase